MGRRRKLRQRELFDPDGPEGLPDDGRPELVRLLAALLREAATGKPMTTTEGGTDEQDHG